MTFCVTGTVAIVKFAAVAPAATVAVGGRVAQAEPSLRETKAPPAGAGSRKTTWPLVEIPPGTVAGNEAKDWMGLGVTVSVVFFTETPTEAWTFTSNWVLTAVVPIAKVVTVPPGGMVTDGGVVTMLALSVKAITRPPTGAGRVMEIRPVVPVPLTTGFGVIVNDAIR